MLLTITDESNQKRVLVRLWLHEDILFPRTVETRFVIRFPSADVLAY